MNSNTGEILSPEAFEQLKKVNALQGKPPAEEWFEIDNKPDPNCRACDGNGFIGYFPNAKVIPCPCVFTTHLAWSLAAVKQRDLAKASTDKGAIAVRSKGSA